MDKRVENIVNRYIHQHDRGQVDENGFPNASGKYSKQGCTYVKFEGSTLWHHSTRVAEQYVTAGGAHIVVMRHISGIIKRYGIDGCSGIYDCTRGSKTTSQLLWHLYQSVPGDIEAIRVPCEIIPRYCGENNVFGTDMGAAYADYILSWMNDFMREGKYKRAKDMENFSIFSKSLERIIKLAADGRGGSESMRPRYKQLVDIRKTIDKYYAGKSVAGQEATGYADYTAKRNEYTTKLNRLKSAIENVAVRLRYLRNNVYVTAYDTDTIAKLKTASFTGWREIADRFGRTVASNVANMILYRDDALVCTDDCSKYAPIKELHDTVDGSIHARNAITEEAYAAGLIQTKHALWCFGGTRRHAGEKYDKLYLRKGPDNSREIYTSRGITIEGGEQALKLIAAMARKIADGEDLSGRRVSCYKIESCSNDGVKVGCHTFSMDNVRLFADLASLPYGEYLPRRFEIYDIGDQEVEAFKVLVDTIKGGYGYDMAAAIKERIAKEAKDLNDELRAATEAKNKFMAEVAERTKKYKEEVKKKKREAAKDSSKKVHA